MLVKTNDMHGANSQNTYKQISHESHVLPFDSKIYMHININSSFNLR